MANKENSVSKELLLEFLNHALSLQESLINMVSVGTFDTL